MALDTRAARATLLRGSALLGPGLGLVTMGATQRRSSITFASEDLAPQTDG